MEGDAELSLNALLQQALEAAGGDHEQALRWALLKMENEPGLASALTALLEAAMEDVYPDVVRGSGES
jgi:hypothetical protein